MSHSIYVVSRASFPIHAITIPKREKKNQNLFNQLMCLYVPWCSQQFGSISKMDNVHSCTLICSAISRAESVDQQTNFPLPLHAAVGRPDHSQSSTHSPVVILVSPRRHRNFPIFENIWCVRVLPLRHDNLQSRIGAPKIVSLLIVFIVFTALYGMEPICHGVKFCRLHCSRHTCSKMVS